MRNKLKEFFGELRSILKTKEMLILPSSLAYFFLLSLIPIVTIIFYVAMSFNLSLDILTNFVEKTFSSSVSSLLQPMITAPTFTVQTFIILIVAFYLAMNGASSIIIASNAIFNVKNSNFFKRKLKSLFIILLFIIVFLFIIVVPIFGSKILELLAYLKIDNSVLEFLNQIFPILKWPISILVVFVFIKLVYTFAPDEKIPSSYVNKGSIFTTIFWLIITFLFSFYINNVVSYSQLYGSLAGIIILLIWFYFLSYIFVIGLAMNFRNMEAQNEKTNTLKLEEIKDRVKEYKNK